MHDKLKSIPTDEFIDLLPEATASILRTGLASATDPNAVVIQIASQPSEGLATRGGAAWPRETIRAIAREIHLAICTDDPKYAKLREKLNGEATVSAAIVVNMISSYVAASVDMLAAMCVPLVTLVLATASKVGFAGWCAAMTASIEPKPEGEANKEGT